MPGEIRREEIPPQMSKFMVLLYANESAMPRPGTPDFEAQNAAYDAIYQNFSKRGVFVSGEPLGPSNSAKSVRVRNGHSTATPGPAASGAEQLIGYYVLDCKSDQEATELAATIPAASVGTVEVRPVFEM
jgi:hypothetical protein